MKKASKYIIKLIFVVILPLINLGLWIGLFTQMTSSVSLTLVMALLSLTTLLNAVFFNSHMKNTNLLPEINFQVMPIIGFAIGVDSNAFTVIIVVPFCAIEITPRKK